jgi:hypothetical protein
MAASPGALTSRVPRVVLERSAVFARAVRRIAKCVSPRLLIPAADANRASLEQGDERNERRRRSSCGVGVDLEVMA